VNPDHLKVSRRRFLKLSALTGAVVGIEQVIGPLPSVSASPVRAPHKALRSKWIATSCLNCQGRCAIRVKVADDRAVRITGNPLSPASEGKVCPRAHIGLQVLYDPDRIHTPLKRTAKEKGKEIDPRWVPISWDEALRQVTSRLNEIRDRLQPHRVLIFSGLHSVSAQDMISRFAEALGTPNLISGEGLDLEAEKSGNWMADGHYGLTSYDLDRTSYILSFGADLLSSGVPLSRFLRKWGRMRRERPGRTKVVVIDPRYSVTASKSDEWIPAHPGTEGALAMAIAHVIIAEDLYDHAFIGRWSNGFDGYRKLALEQYSPDLISKITGIPPETIRRVAREFAKTGPGLAIRGKEALSRPDGSYISYAIFCLNALVGSIDIPGGIIYQEAPSYRDMGPVIEDKATQRGRSQPGIDLGGTERFLGTRAVTNRVPDSLIEGKPYPIEMAIGFNSNFNMTAPSCHRWDQALKKLPYYVHISPFISEMALYADLVLPSTTYLEEWGYDHPSAGGGLAEMRIKQPAIPPRGDARPVIDMIFEMSRRMKGGVAGSFAALGGNSEGFVKFRTGPLIPWEELLKKGVWVGREYRYRKYDRLFRTPSKKFEFESGNLRSFLSKTGSIKKGETDFLPRSGEMRFLGESEKYPLILLPYQPLLMMGNGSQNYPWAQEIYLPMQGMGWDIVMEINSRTAETFHLRNGQRVWAESPFGRIRGRLKLSEGIHPEVLAIPSGQGHYAYGKWQKGIGANPNEIIGVDDDRVSGQPSSLNTRVKVYPV